VPLAIKITSTPAKYLGNLDRPTRDRIVQKLNSIAANPEDSRLSKPLQVSSKRCTRIGRYRVLFTIEDDSIVVSDIDSRGQVYRNA
jgi:mRNA interferase RelE/StbE